MSNISFFAASLRNRVVCMLLAAVGVAAQVALPVLAAGSITVTGNADTGTPGDGFCTLREALANANTDSDTSGGDCAAGSGVDLIEFAPGLNGHTITLAGAELVISSNLTLSGPGADLLAVSGGNASRVISVTNGIVVISGLTIRDGAVSGANGGGIYTSATLTLDHVTVAGNSITGGGSTNGGGIHNSGVLTVTHSAIISNTNLGSFGRGGGLANNGIANLSNSTISSNRSNSYGGGIFNGTAAVLTSTFNTIARNVAVSYLGGGFSQQSSTAKATIKNTLLADNTATATNSKNDCDYLVSAPVSQGYNLVESAGTCVFTATGDLTGVDPNLGPLTRNGGHTLTHAPLNGSAITEYIPPGVNGCGCNSDIPTDQRDYLRANACSVGATEYSGIWLTLQKYASDNSPTPGQTITYTLVATLTPSDNVSVTNLLMTDTLPTGINLAGVPAIEDGSGSSSGSLPTLVSGLALTGGQSVTATFPVTVSTGQTVGTQLTNTARISIDECPAPVVTSHRLTISNIAPVAVGDSLLVAEDSGLTTTQVMANDFDLNGDSLSLSAIGPGNHGGVTGLGTGVISYTPAVNFNGTEVFTYTITDGALTGTGVVTVSVTTLNDAPSFGAGAAQWWRQTGGPRTVPGWATAISPGPADEAGQSLTFTLSTDNPALFLAQPALSATGQLGFTPNPASSGTALVTVTLQDSGGVALGGADTSSPQAFPIYIVPGDALGGIDPVTGGSLDYIDPSTGMTTTIQAGGGAVTSAIHLAYDELPASGHPRPAGYNFAGRYFTLDAYQSGRELAGYQFLTPITLTLSYSPDPAAMNYADETTLVLRHWNGSTWDSGGIILLNHDLANHRLTVQLNHLSEYALVGYAPVLELAPQVDTLQNPPMPGSVVTYTLTFSNNGSLPASGVAISQTLPGGLSFINWVAQNSADFNSTNNTLTWGPQPLAVSIPVTVCFTARITPSVAISNTTITSTAYYSSANAGFGTAEVAFTTSYFYEKYFPVIYRDSER